MSLEEKAVQGQQQGRLTDDEEADLKIMVNLGKNMIDEGGAQVVEQALASKDPGVILGQFLYQLGGQLAEKLPFDPSPRIMLAQGGFLEQISDYLQEQYDVPKKVADRAEIYIASSAQAQAQQKQAQPAQAQPAEGQAPAVPVPSGGM